MSSFYFLSFFIRLPIHSHMQLFFFSISFFFIPSSIMIIKSLHLHSVVQRWGLSAATQFVEQNRTKRTECNFFYLYIDFLFFLSFFASSLFRPRATTTPIVTLVGSAAYIGKPCAVSLSFAQEYSSLLWERKRRSQHLRIQLPFI